METAAKMQRDKDKGALLREIPSVDELLGRPRLVSLAGTAGRPAVTQAARDVLADLRARLKAGGKEAATREAIEARVVAEVESLLAPSLRRVINATGVILHTNLGRAPLSAAAAAAIAETAARYSNLNTTSPAAGAASATSTQRACWLNLRARNRPLLSTITPQRSFSF